MMGLIFAKLWSLFCNQGEKDGAARRLESEAEGLAADGDTGGRGRSVRRSGGGRELGQGAGRNSVF